MNKESFRNTELIQASLKKRYAREKRFQWYGRLAVLAGFVFLFILLFDIVSKGTPAFTQQYLKIQVHFDPERLDIPQDVIELETLGFDLLVRQGPEHEGIVTVGAVREPERVRHGDHHATPVMRKSVCRRELEVPRRAES